MTIKPPNPIEHTQSWWLLFSFNRRLPRSGGYIRVVPYKDISRSGSSSLALVDASPTTSKSTWCQTLVHHNKKNINIK
jgi:hypothetical protein